MDGHAKLIFADLSDEEIISNFVSTTSMQNITQLTSELRFGTLLSTASWLATNQKEGCIRCAPFLARQKLTPFPDRPIDLIRREMVPVDRKREKNIAYQVVKNAVENPEEKSIVAFVSQEHLMPVTKEIGRFLSNPDEFAGYERPA